MPTLDYTEWRRLKGTTRARRRRQRLEQLKTIDRGPWLRSMDRDTRTDPVERKLVLVVGNAMRAPNER